MAYIRRSRVSTSYSPAVKLGYDGCLSRKKGIRLIPRYTREEMGRVWSDANKYSKWLEVELAATETLAEAGRVPGEAAAVIRSRATVDATRVNELEARVKHD